MKVLLIHNEAQYFGGAETVLGYLLSAMAQGGCPLTVATVQGSKFASLIPETIPKIWISDNSRLSLVKITRQIHGLIRAAGGGSWDLIHGWAVRDWELASVLGRLTHRPVVGTLHDHPQSSYLSAKRQMLMRSCARWGIQKLVCVSEAVRQACIMAGYSPGRLVVVHNGLPERALGGESGSGATVRLGYLGVFSVQKGLKTLFEIGAELSRMSLPPWELVLAGAAQEATGRTALQEIQSRYQSCAWWSRVKWVGWVEQPMEFLQSLDLLVFPSLAFDSLPTVLLEAGNVGVPVVASRIGGGAEIIQDGQTGWLFDPGNSGQGARLIARLIQDPALRERMGRQARQRIRQEFSVEKMVAQYRQIYSTV